ncbi:MAG: mechanosensitive ion channel family protein [Candidatus Acidiferrales bacterium]
MSDLRAQITENAVILNTVKVAVIALLAVVLICIMKAVTARLVEMANSPSRVAQMREQQTRAMANLLYSAGTMLVIIAALLMALPYFGFDITPLAAAAGLASLALGFGGQYLVRDLINGFLIVFEDQYVVGDTIKVDDETGRVEQVSLRRTVLRNFRGAVVSIPNGQIGRVANLSRDWSQTWVDVTVPSEESVAAALRALEKITTDFRSDPDWSAALMEGPRVLGIDSMALSGITIRIQIRTAPLRQEDVARELRRRLKAGFEQEHIPLNSVQRVELVGANKNGL